MAAESATIKLSQATHFLMLNPSKFLFCTSFTKLLCLHILVGIPTPALQASGEVQGARRDAKANCRLVLLPAMEAAHLRGALQGTSLQGLWKVQANLQGEKKKPI